MATEYTKIGRIRPVFKGAWNSAAAYTILDIVHTADGSRAYAAVKDVPAGTQLTNTAYWQPVIDMQALVSRVEQAEENVSTAVSAVSGKAPAIECSASGNPVNVSDSADALLLGLKLFGKTTQDGVPSPDAPVELVNAGEDGEIGVAVYGKNIADITYGAQVPSTGTGYDVSVAGWVSDYIYIGNNIVTLTRDDPTAVTEMYLFLYDKDKNHIGNIGSSKAGDALCSNGISGYENARYCRVRMSEGSGSSRRLQLEIGGTATAYEPCAAQSVVLSTPNGLPGIPVSSGGNYTDENGQQWICDEIDLARGVYIKRLGLYAITGAESWGSLSAGVNDGLYAYQLAANTVPEYLADTKNGLCSHLCNLRTYGKTDGTVYFGGRVTMTVAEHTTADSWKAFLAAQYAAGTPVTVLYPLVTPIETALSAAELAAYAVLRTNKPATNVLNDSGAGMQLDYAADTKTYIDNKFAALAAAMIANA